MTALAPEEEQPAYPPLELTDGEPRLVADPDGVRDVAEQIAAGVGPVAIDTERASGYRYSQRAYLLQLRREGAGTWLIDPLGCPDLSELAAALADLEWVLHAASQDLPCLTEAGLHTQRIFDTELAARLAGYERVGLATMTEVVFGRTMAKGHSSADWSVRPLRAAMLVYAALDVEVLLPLREQLERELREQGKWAWAQEEFAALVTMPPPAPRTDPWRRTSGIHRVRGARALAGVRALWETRDEIARRTDIAPGRVLPDAAIVAAIQATPETIEALTLVPGFKSPAARRNLRRWFTALREAAALPESALPRVVAGEGPPPAARWADRDPVAAGRLARARTVLSELAETHALPVENLLEPAVLRKLAWTPPPTVDDEQVIAVALRELGARPWQAELTAAALATALPEQ